MPSVNLWNTPSKTFAKTPFKFATMDSVQKLWKSPKTFRFLSLPLQQSRFRFLVSRLVWKVPGLKTNGKRIFSSPRANGLEPVTEEKTCENKTVQNKNTGSQPTGESPVVLNALKKHTIRRKTILRNKNFPPSWLFFFCKHHFWSMSPGRCIVLSLASLPRHNFRLEKQKSS